MKRPLWSGVYSVASVSVCGVWAWGMGLCEHTGKELQRGVCSSSCTLLVDAPDSTQAARLSKKHARRPSTTVSRGQRHCMNQHDALAGILAAAAKPAPRCRYLPSPLLMPRRRRRANFRAAAEVQGPSLISRARCDRRKITAGAQAVVIRPPRRIHLCVLIGTHCSAMSSQPPVIQSIRSIDRSTCCWEGFGFWKTPPLNATQLD
jgi:hypothetical protein